MAMAAVRELEHLSLNLSKLLFAMEILLGLLFELLEPIKMEERQALLFQARMHKNA
jgi:hypothetical protein